MVKQYALWGTKNGVEDIVRVNGKETFSKLSDVEKFKRILIKRGDLTNLRIQTIDLDNWDMKSAFIGTVK